MKILSPKAALLASGILLCAACGNAVSTRSTIYAPGRIYTSVACKADTAVDYALCLPKGYSPEDTFLLVMLFDPHGDGLLPVNLFAGEASKRRIIIAGSNDSRNGMATSQALDIYRKMRADLAEKFNIFDAVYTAGFSGGARVAATAAISEGNVQGVVGCGAGWPAYDKNPAKQFSYLGVAGNRDFNLAELRQLDAELAEAGITHHLVTFEGKHEWPPATLVPDIVTWVLFDAMRSRTIPADRAAINAFIETSAKQADAESAAGDYIAARQTLLKMLHYLGGLTDTAPLQQEIDRLGSMPAVKTAEAEQLAKLDTERRLQQQYVPLVESKPAAWWKKEAALLHSKTSGAGNAGEAAIYERLLGALSLNCYMLAANALKQGDWEQAANVVEIYRQVDPENAEHRYMAARIAAHGNRPAEALTCLREAAKLGFKDQKRAFSEPDFRPLLNDPEFRAVFPEK